jgi:hypothetical protein
MHDGLVVIWNLLGQVHEQFLLFAKHAFLMCYDVVIFYGNKLIAVWPKDEEMKQ